MVMGRPERLQAGVKVGARGVISGSVFLVLWVAMLGLSYRRFFRR